VETGIPLRPINLSVMHPQSLRIGPLREKNLMPAAVQIHAADRSPRIVGIIQKMSSGIDAYTDQPGKPSPNNARVFAVQLHRPDLRRVRPVDLTRYDRLALFEFEREDAIIRIQCINTISDNDRLAD